MKVLFDANIVLDVLLKRSGFAQAALAIARVERAMAEENGIPWLATRNVGDLRGNRSVRVVSVDEVIRKSGG